MYSILHNHLFGGNIMAINQDGELSVTFPSREENMNRAQTTEAPSISQETAKSFSASIGDAHSFGWSGPQGWICPKCGRVYSPSTPMCYFCSGNDSGGNQFTCGTSNTGDKFPLSTFPFTWSTNESSGGTNNGKD